jgi:pantetheine-phosphate adenylyltransferase
MLKKRALYVGSFDPFTNGHFDILNRSLAIFDEVVIVIAKSPSKNNLFSFDERQAMLEELVKDLPQVSVDIWEGLIVEYAKKNNINYIVRGLRPTGDFEIEFQMAAMNRKLSGTVETVFLMSDEDTYFVSSSLVKEIHGHGGNIDEFVPTKILKKMNEKKKNK